MHEPVPQLPAEVPVPQPQHEMPGMTFEWLSGRVAELDALDEAGAGSEWWRQYQEAGRQVLDFVRQHPEEGRSLFWAMTMSEQIADKRFIARQLADYMNVGQREEEEGAGCFAALLMDGRDGADEAADFALNDAIRERRLVIEQVAHIAFATAERAQDKIQRLETQQTQPRQP